MSDVLAVLGLIFLGRWTFLAARFLLSWLNKHEGGEFW